MTAVSVTIEPAQPTDLAELVTVHGVVFAGTMGVALGRRYSEAFIARFIREPDQVALVARREGRIVGYVLGRSTATADSDRAAKIAAGIGLLTHPWLVVRPQVRQEVAAKALGRGTPREDLDDRLVAAQGDLVGIGTMPTERGKGTAKALVAAFVEACEQHGWSGVSLSVYRDNLSARKLYEGCGFIEIDHPDRPDLVFQYLDAAAA